MLVAETGGNTCGSIQMMAAKEVNGSDTCAIIQKEERVLKRECAAQGLNIEYSLSKLLVNIISLGLSLRKHNINIKIQPPGSATQQSQAGVEPNADF